MKTFTDLIFNPHPRVPGLKARLMFENGFGIDVVLGNLFISNGINTYEVVILDKNGVIYDKDPNITGIYGHVTKDGVISIMEQIQKFEPVK